MGFKDRITEEQKIETDGALYVLILLCPRKKICSYVIMSKKKYVLMLLCLRKNLFLCYYVLEKNCSFVIMSKKK